MIIDQIKSFREKQEKLPSALQNFESADLKALDTDLTAILEVIYSHKPRNMCDFRSLMEFFLDLLVASDCGADSRIVSRIEELTYYAVTLVPPKRKHLRII